MSLQRVRKPRVGEGLSRVFDSEKLVTETLLNGFDYQGSKGEKILEYILGSSICENSRNSVRAIVHFLSCMLQKKVTRNVYRNKKLLIKWVDDYSDLIMKILLTTNIICEK